MPQDHLVWTFMTVISGVSEELERARLLSSGLPTLLDCQVSGIALRDEKESAWNLTVHRDGHELGGGETGRMYEDLDPLFEEALRSSGILVATSEERRDDACLPCSLVDLGIQTLAVAPLRTLQGCLGMILAGRENGERFSQDERVILSTLAEHFAVGLENLRLCGALKHYSQDLERVIEERTEKLRRTERRQRVLLEVNNAIIANLDRESLFQAIADSLRKVLPFDRVTLTLLDQEKDVIKVHSLASTLPSNRFLTVGTEFPRQGSPLASVYETKQPLIRHHLERGDRIGVEKILLKEGILSYIAVPLTARREIFGTLNLGSQAPDEYSDQDAAFLAEIAQQVALAVENMLAYEEITQLKSRLEQENLYLQDEIEVEHGFGEIVGRSSALRAVLRQIEQVAPTDATVLILGESGTGKELVAREIHKRSRRRDRPLIRVNCASIPRELYESEFFGHVRGAFTGALKDRAGRFQLADGGTLFLDEVGEIPVELQGKLLRVLQEHQYERVGEERTRQVDVRIIAATNRDLRKDVEAGGFRQDLYYRLNVFPIEVAPLRRRKDDIPLLAAHLLEGAAKKLNCSKPRLTQADISKLQTYDWPGNVREMQNVIERAVIASRCGALQIALPGARNAEAASPQSAARRESTHEVGVIPEAEFKRRERENLLAALRLSDWKVYGAGGAAQLLGVKPTTLISRMRKLGLNKRV